MITWFHKRKTLISFNHPIKNSHMMVITVKDLVKILDLLVHLQRLSIRTLRNLEVKASLSNTTKDHLKFTPLWKSTTHLVGNHNSLSLVVKRNSLCNNIKRKLLLTNMIWIRVIKTQSQLLDKGQRSNSTIKHNLTGDNIMRNQFNRNLMEVDLDMANKNRVNSNKVMNRHLGKE